MDKMIELSTEIINHSLKSLGMEFSYLSYPLGLISYTSDDIEGKGYTDGKVTTLNAKWVVESVANGCIKEVDSLILHALMHCLFLHPFKKVEDIERYDLATDITVGYVLDSLGYSHGDRRDTERRKMTYKSIIETFGGVNDNFCYGYCKEIEKEKVDELSTVFKLCSHDAWLGHEAKGDNLAFDETLNISFGQMQEADAESLKEAWGSVAKNLIPQIGKLNPALKRIISVSVGEVSNYKAFLKSFLRRRERVRPSDEEFDYIYYCLGLQTYGNVPLIENLEYSDRRDYSDIAIAVDTSGSTDGEPIKRLLQEVFSMIKSMETESKRYRLRIIQCDLKIHKEDVVCTAEEFAELLKIYRLEGGGGTDFRPVFEHLTNLKKKGEKIEGLIYFTDGVGVYPREIPPFKSCFAILGENEGVSVPHFAYRINIED